MKSNVSEPLAERGGEGLEPSLTGSEFGEIYQEHSRAIYYLALRFLSDPQKARMRRMTYF